jgi:predicted secreted Zn-dependent protease
VCYLTLAQARAYDLKRGIRLLDRMAAFTSREQAMKFLLSLALLLTVSLYAHAEVTDKLDYKEIEVRADDVNSNDSTVAPAVQKEMRLHSDMKWGVRWNFRFAERKGKCRVTRINAHVEGNATLPRLIGGSAEQRLEFERFVGEQKAVHSELMAIGRSAAMEIERQLMALPPASSCKSLQTHAHDTAERIMDEYNARSESYRSGKDGARDAVF